MSVTGADLARWAAHRRAVVAAVSRRVPGVDPELAASRGLELLCAELVRAGHVADPVAFWNGAALDVAESMAAESMAAESTAAERGASDGSATGDATTADAAPRTIDFEVLGSALERLSAAEQRILWDHHVGSQPVSAIAEEIGVLPYAARRRLRRAENRLASSFAETHADTTDGAECRQTRAALHDFVRNRLMPHRRQAVEDHMVQCPGCTRAFVDVRESYWMLRAVAPLLLLGAVATRTGTAVAAGTGVATAGAGFGAWLGSVGARVVLVVRTAFLDPVALTATVAGGLIVTTAVSTGTVGSGGTPPPREPGVVSVSVADDPVGTTGAADRPDTRRAGPGPARDEAPGGPERTAFTPPGLAETNGVPPGLAETGGVPPGLAKTDGVPPGQATDDGTAPGRAAGDSPATGSGNGANPPGGDQVPPGLAKSDGVPPGLAKKDGVPPGQAKKGTPPPGQATKDVPPGQAKKDTPPGQAKKGSSGTGAETGADGTPPGLAKQDGVPPGQARKQAGRTAWPPDEGYAPPGYPDGSERANGRRPDDGRPSDRSDRYEHDRRAGDRRHGRDGQDRWRSTSTS